jgi:carboxyl-terminal processing protease
MINNHYVDSVNYTTFENNTINSTLRELDPHSSYISIKDFKAVEEDMQGSFSGIGVEFNIIEDSIVVVSPISGGPSEKLGIQSGDRIISVEEEDVASTGVKNEDVIKLLRGEKGSAVNIIIKRRGQDELIAFTIIRDDIPLYSVDAGIMLTNDIAYIKINRFAATTYNEMMEKANKLTKKGMRKLILDFRGNPGGYLYIANQICDEFLKAGELIVFTEGRNRSKKETFATKNGLLENIKVIALINEGSASASEIVSGALQDNDRGLVIGRRSFGKGLVQEQITLNDGSVMRLTTQRYYTPSGRCIQKDYGGNTKDYYLEQYTRKDTLTHHSNSLKYTTKKGRIVYGGGGITPDIIIKRDTTLNYLQINKIMSKGWINKFCFEKSEDLRKQNISNYNQIDMANMYANFTQYLKQKNSKFELKLGAAEFKYLENLLLGGIARNLWGNDTYYQVLSLEDEYIQRAINEF